MPLYTTFNPPPLTADANALSKYAPDGVFSVAIGIIYRMVPTQTPRWAAILRPALAVGFALAVLTGIFALITPRLVGSLRVYGAFVAVFAAMIWLSYVAQAILVGAAWVHRRSTTDDQDELARGQG